MSVSFESLKTQVEYLKSKGFTFHSLNDFLSANHNSILIVFDDGYDSILKASDYLSALNIPFGISVIFNKLGANGYLSLRDLTILKKDNDIYYHGKTHTGLSNLTLAQKKSEILDGKNELEKMLGKKVDTFVYPLGEYDLETVNIVSDQYKYGLSLLPFHYKSNNNFILPRINVRGDMGFLKFKFFLSYSGNAYLHLSYFVKKIFKIDYLR
jgi:peptidoglycan/xylan/chitin deacetylase (PgdA/CDA1 family)